LNIIISKNGVPIRLTSERWQHITLGHPEIADYYYDLLNAIENPDIIYEGSNGAKIAVKLLEEREDKFVVAVYKEVTANDGFVITVYLSEKKQEFEKKTVLWKQQN
jgi:hypothetical protein